MLESHEPEAVVETVPVTLLGQHHVVQLSEGGEVITKLLKGGRGRDPPHKKLSYLLVDILLNLFLGLDLGPDDCQLVSRPGVRERGGSG